MGTQEREAFEKNWEKFVTRIRGQIASQQKNGIFSYGSLRLILADSQRFWESGEFEGARWLDAYEKSHSGKARRVRAILLEDMSFTEEPSPKSGGKALAVAVPLGSAAAGFFAARAIGAGGAMQLAGAIVPALVAAPLTQGAVQAVSERKGKDQVDSYIRQLDKYKISVERILDEREMDGAEGK